MFFRYDAKLKRFARYLPVYGLVGDLLQILGQRFTAGSVVMFNGVLATTKVVFPTYIRAFVPGGATTGYITVTTSSGTLQSDEVFVVRQ